MTISPLPTTTRIDTPPRRRVFPRVLIGCADRLGAVAVLLLAAGLGKAYESTKVGGGSKLLAFALVPALVALVASLWANDRRRQHGLRARWGLTAFNVALIGAIVVALIADQSGTFSTWKAVVDRWMQDPTFHFPWLHEKAR